jgi:iron complex transport system ATP-binding protein
MKSVTDNYKSIDCTGFGTRYPLIILDEPTTHLDLLHKVALFKLLKKLTQETGKCILFSTHDIDMAIQLSDEMIMTPEIVLRRTLQFHCKGSFNTLFKDEHIVLMLKGSL